MLGFGSLGIDVSYVERLATARSCGMSQGWCVNEFLTTSFRRPAAAALAYVISARDGFTSSVAFLKCSSTDCALRHMQKPSKRVSAEVAAKIQNALAMSDIDARAALVAWRWPERVICARCQSENIYRIWSRDAVFRCGACKSDFTAFSGTPLSHGKAPPQIYVAAIEAFLRQRIPAVRFAEIAGVQYRTAWRLRGVVQQFGFQGGEL